MASADDHISLPPPFMLHGPFSFQQNHQLHRYNGSEDASTSDHSIDTQDRERDYDDADLESGVYDQRSEPVSELLSGPNLRIPGLSTSDVRDVYPAWSTEHQIPLSKEEIEDVFMDLTQKLGFQRDSMRNMFDFTMQLLDSRASRMSPDQALLTIHADYIGGQDANYRKWYFAAQIDLDDAVSQTQNPALQRLNFTKYHKSLTDSTERWRQIMNNMSPRERMQQIALYLLCWGEAAHVRFAPEFLCFIFKCADDYYRSPECQSHVQPVKEGLYLQNVIKPIYRFIRDQGYEIVDSRFIRREKDHAEIIGYDDINQLFWSPQGMTRIVLNDNTRFMDLLPSQRFCKFNRIQWSRTFFKTYYEKRSLGHWLVNFNRIWVIHVAVYWFYTAYNSPKIYNGTQSAPMRWSATAFGGAVATIIMIFASIAEFSYLPITWDNTSHLVRRMFFLLMTLALTAGPTIYIAKMESRVPNQRVSLILGIVQFSISVVATLIFAVVPSARMIGGHAPGKSRNYIASQAFTASYAPMTIQQRLSSVSLWLLVFGCKFTGSYWFLTFSFRQPIDAMVGLKVKACHDKHFGDAICANQISFALTAMYIMDLVLFFLDTFLWWIIWNVVLSIMRSFYLGLSTWTPWRTIYTQLPTRIYSKLLANSCHEIEHKAEILVSEIWNAIITSMYRDHLLSIDHVQNLLYTQVATNEGQLMLKAPLFFDFQPDSGFGGEFFPRGGDAERRISYFARSLATTIPESIPVDAIPTFTVFTPHYSEKILSSLREVIGESYGARITLLEYLKQLHPVEWDNFVKDTQILAQESAPDDGSLPVVDLPFYSVGFKTASPEFTLRTRIWSSLRTQTLYRTVSGMMNYAQAIKLLYQVEKPGVVQTFHGSTEGLERELDWRVRRKFKFIVAMQRYSRFNQEEHDNAEFLLRAYPDLQIAYLEEEPPKKEGGEHRLFSALIDGNSQFDVKTARRRPKYRIELPGNPILGDGKSDNQNHAIIFCRGEYLQLIDANQDNYLEECLKIRNVLGEFEQYDVPRQDPYAQGDHDVTKPPVAIVGACEYIFSENIGVLGDLAAREEQAFGTLTGRSLSWLGGKLHYGHTDFLNTLYMTTRGGISKAQKGLHLNDDIYAGMNAFGRGGRIKHTDYYRCGKGRDLGFGTILNFLTKMGTGMSEQMLSREYYYLGTRLPIDRFLTFYYAHPGLQVNNILIILAVQVFVVTMVLIGTLNSSLTCPFNVNGQLLNGADGGCYFLTLTFGWVARCIITILLVFVIGFLPPFLQELMDRGAKKALLQLGKQLLSFSPAFRFFATRISSHSITQNLAFGGARYIATGRGFATSRISYSILFSRFSAPSIYLGMRTLVMLLYVTITLWTPWITFVWAWILALCISPFIFNPHQFLFVDFFIDYREFLRWMSRGNQRSHNNSWIGYHRLSRAMITGYKKKRLGHPSEKLSGDIPRATLRAVFFPVMVWPVITAVIFTIAYMFVKSFPDRDGNQPPNGPLVRIVVISTGPIVWNAGVLVIQFPISLLVGPLLDPSFPRFAPTMASIVHALSLVGMIGFFEFLWFLELWDASPAVLGLIVMIFFQRAIFKIISMVLTREFKHDETNKAWWTGRWYGRGLGIHVLSQLPREFVVKTMELSLWSSDFLIGHVLLFMLAPPLLVPYFDKLHSMLLFWLRPFDQFRAPIFSIRQKQQRRWIVIKYGIIFVLAAGVFSVLLVMPLILPNVRNSDCSLCRVL